ncbi:hypothetical protein [Nonlabens marinus]|uniref:SMODS-associated and fused to various effectors domain-containing protein n=1 Tax=Nonlabens marinus S1-08 TaxID=1454201 RepID=W8VPE5_9FLAO|nr:hypothetical protein [Nonlabens marinus]BAO55009.1 hypothetical protein NMS_1000 [Nonlabens marinus S1-08]
MKLSYGKQIEIDRLSEVTIDILIFAKNHEERALTAFNYISAKTDVLNAIAFTYDDNTIPIEGIKFIHIDNQVDIISFLDESILDSDLTSLNILVDYSCMTKPWYYTIILYLSQKKLNQQELNLYFVYTPSKYSKPMAPKPNTVIAPLPGKYVVPTNKPKALIVCLGYEQNKAQGIIEHLDPKVCYIFYSKPALDDAFVKTIEENNRELIDHNSNVITFPLDDLIVIERELVSLYHFLRKDYSIIIAPLGPKPFTFMAMLLSIKYTDIDIWRVGSGSDINEYERKPVSNSSFIVSYVNFTAN